MLWFAGKIQSGSMNDPSQKFYVTTPIYYVNDRPHIGHVYTTTMADMVARYHRLCGRDVFFLTGVDEHAAKVADAAAERGLSPQQWADENAKVFQDTFGRLGISNNDFIRTSQDRHKTRVTKYVKQLLESGDVYAGEYEGWYDASQEEYVPQTKAKEHDYHSPVTGRPLVRKREKNYFFRLSHYQDRLLDLIEKDNTTFVQPSARRNEVLARIREGLNDVPISRTGTGGWGIPMPNDSKQTIYVWIDALFNYLTAIDTDEAIQYWPADTHFIAKDILWFHAVIWPAMLIALDRPLPRQVYTHAYWISEGQKMSKSLDNFIDLEKIDQYIHDFGLDVFRYFMATEGPLGATDSDFTHSRFVKVYNADLANTLGNCLSRITNMTGRYFGGQLPEHGPHVEASESHAHMAEQTVLKLTEAFDRSQPQDAATAALNLVRAIDSYIEQTQPFKLAKQKDRLPEVGTILYNCAEAMRIASLCLWPIMPNKAQEIWQRLACDTYAAALVNKGTGQFHQWTKWGQLCPGQSIDEGKPLFPRHQG